MLILRSADSDILKEIHDGSFPLPDLSNPLYFGQCTAIENGEVIGVGLVRLTCEGILITDQSKPVTQRARASKAIIESAREQAKFKGLEDCHVFVRQPNVIKFLEHLGFAISKSGTAMVTHL